MLRTRLATTAVALPLIYLAVRYLPPVPFAGLTVALTALGLDEYFRMALSDRPRERAAGVALGLGVAAGVASREPALAGLAFGLALVGGFVVALGGIGGREEIAAAVGRLGCSVLGILWAGFLLPHLVLLRALPQGWRWVIFALGVAMASDGAGYFVGTGLGRHKLMPEVSPAKTVEGLVGALGGALLAAALARWLFLPRPWGEVVALGAVVGVLAQLGDLSESLLKRAFGAKDSGWIVPGHGGILDRIDSLVFPVVFTYYYAAFSRS